MFPSDTSNSGTIHFHNSQPTPTSTQLVAPPFRCTCLLPFPNSSNKSLREHLAASHIGAPAKPPCQPPFLHYRLICHATYQCVLLPNSWEWLPHTFFFSCIAVLVRDIVGQQLEWVKIENKFPPKAKANKNKHTTKQPTKPNQAKIQGNLQKRWNRWNVRVPLKPLTSSLPPSSIAPRCPCLDVSHINVCTRIPRRVSREWLPHTGAPAQTERGKKKEKTYIYMYLSIFPCLWGQREWNPPSYDSRVHGLTRQLGTSPPRTHPPALLSVFLSACPPWSSSCFSLGPARPGHIQSDRAMLRFHGW